MKNAARQIILSAAALLVCCFVIRAAFFDHLNIYIPLYEDGQPAPEIRLSNPDVMRLGETEIRSGYVRIPVWPESAGETDLIAGAETDSAVVVHSLYADSLRTVYDRNTGNCRRSLALRRQPPHGLRPEHRQFHRRFRRADLPDPVLAAAQRNHAVALPAGEGRRFL